MNNLNVVARLLELILHTIKIVNWLVLKGAVSEFRSFTECVTLYFVFSWIHTASFSQPFIQWHPEWF